MPPINATDRLHRRLCTRMSSACRSPDGNINLLVVACDHSSRAAYRPTRPFSPTEPVETERKKKKHRNTPTPILRVPFIYTASQKSVDFHRTNRVHPLSVARGSSEYTSACRLCNDNSYVTRSVAVVVTAIFASEVGKNLMGRARACRQNNRLSRCD